LDIKNVSCGNLTTGEGRRGDAGCGRSARKAREGCVKKHERNGKGRGATGPGEWVTAADTEYENFYDFYALAPAHLEIRFNSLNFKKLPPLPLAPSAADRAVPDPSPAHPSPSYPFFSPPPLPLGPLPVLRPAFVLPRKTKLRRFTPSGIKSWMLLGAPTVPPLCNPTLGRRLTTRAPTTPPWTLKHARVFSPFARPPMARLGLGIARLTWRLSRRNALSSGGAWLCLLAVVPLFPESASLTRRNNVDLPSNAMNAMKWKFRGVSISAYDYARSLERRCRLRKR